MVPFGGWEMPLSYPTGTLAEHRACREAAAVFDVSHLGTVRVEGPDAFDRLQAVLTNDLGRIGPGRAQYTHLLDDADASVLDDLVVWWVGERRFDVMANASNTDRVRQALGGRDVTAERVVLAIQGPRAREHLAHLWPEAAQVRRFGLTVLERAGDEAVVAGTGYTGEDGVEVALSPAPAEVLWQALVDDGVTPAGLGARDTLRLEAALPLHGQELGPGITPLQAGLAWVVAWDKPGGFQGQDALAAERERGVARRLRGLAAEGRRPPRAGQQVALDGEPVGVVTSGNFSPVLGHGIALAFLPPAVGEGTEVTIEARGEPLAARVVPTPFVRRRST